MGSTVHIGNVIRHAIAFNPRKQFGTPVHTDSLLQDVARLFTLLHERHVEYVLVGGVAMLQYVEGRNTEDIDLIMALSDVHKVPEIVVTSQEVDFARGKFGAAQIDFLLTRHPLFAKVRQAYVTMRPFAEQNIPCATVEGLLLLKLYALPSLYRQGNFARVGLYENDIATLMHDYQPVLDPLFDELAHHLSASDLAALRDIVADIQQRIGRFQQGFGKGS